MTDPKQEIEKIKARVSAADAPIYKHWDGVPVAAEKTDSWNTLLTTDLPRLLSCLEIALEALDHYADPTMYEDRGMGVTSEHTANEAQSKITEILCGGRE